MSKIFAALLSVIIMFSPFSVFASEQGGGVKMIHAGLAPLGILAIIIFILAYIGVLAEEVSHMRKSKPVMLGAGLIWVCVALLAPSYGATHDDIHAAMMHVLSEYAALFLFLLSAMTYISALENRKVFEVLKDKLILRGLTYRQLFWVTGVIAFFLSSIADNMTTALVMGAVVITVGKGNKDFIIPGCINIVSAANAGGAFCPFGDITTLMVWQAGKVEFFEFFDLFIPSAVCFLIPAAIMSFFVPNIKPQVSEVKTQLRHGAKMIIFLGIFTIALAVTLEKTLGLPPFLGMMFGMSLLMVHAWYIRSGSKKYDKDYDIFNNIAAAEWDTLLFFFGIIFSVSGLAYLGYLELVSTTLYGQGATIANITLGAASAVIDNIPIMYAILTMNPDMDHFQWLLVTMTAGTGGSMLSIGSAAGVALMGTSRGEYTFFGHLKWTPVIALGYAAAIGTHFLVNSHLIGVH